MEWLNAWFELGRQIWKFQIWLPRSSEGFPARASTFVQGSARATIERRSRVNSQHPVFFSVFADRSSGGFLARAKPLILDLRSSGESLARAKLLFSAYFAKYFLRVFLHPHPILGILRPSLRHLDEDIIVEHTKAN